MDDIFDILLPVIMAIGALGLQLLKKKNKEPKRVPENSTFFDEMFDESVDHNFDTRMDTESNTPVDFDEVQEPMYASQPNEEEMFVNNETSMNTMEQQPKIQMENTVQKKRHRFNLRQAVIQTEILNAKYLK